MSKFTTGGFGYDEDDVEFVPGVRRGLRQWYLTPEPTTGRIGLKSISWPYWWQPSVNVSRCFLENDDRLSDRIGCRDTLHPETPGVHGPDCPRRPVCPYPTTECVCGFYAYTSADTGRYLTKTNDLPFVAGVIEGFGRLVVGEKGFRAHRAIIVAVAEPITWQGDKARDDGPTLEQLRGTWPHLAIYPSLTVMLEAVPLGDRLEL